MRTPFEQYDAYISEAFSEQYWCDAGGESAEEILETFTDRDWAALTAAWPNRSPQWIERMAYNLSSVDPFRSIPLLAALANRCQIESLGTVACSLRALDDASLLAALDEEGSRRLAEAARIEKQLYRHELEDVLARRAKLLNPGG